MESQNGKNTITKIKNLLHRSKGIVDGAEERISKLEGSSAGNTQIEAQTEKKKMENTENSTNVTCNTTKVLTYVSGVQKGEERDNGVEIILLAKIYQPKILYTWHKHQTKQGNYKETILRHIEVNWLKIKNREKS